MPKTEQTIGEAQGEATELPPNLTVTFKEPLKNKANDDIVRMTLREPNVGELSEVFSAHTTVTEQMIALISKVGGNPVFVVRQMLVSDFNVCRDYLMGFINASAPVT